MKAMAPRALQEENELLKQKLADVQRRLSAFVARNAKLEALLCSTSPHSPDVVSSRSLSDFGNNALLHIGSRPGCSLNDMSDDTLLHIVHFLTETQDAVAITRLRQCCKAVGSLIASAKLSDSLGRLSWLYSESHLTLDAIGTERQVFTCSDHPAGGGPVWLASSKLPRSGRVSWSITIHHDTFFMDVWGEHLIGVCNAESTWAWGAAPQLRQAGEISVWNVCRAYEQAPLSLFHAGERGPVFAHLSRGA